MLITFYLSHAIELDRTLQWSSFIVLFFVGKKPKEHPKRTTPNKEVKRRITSFTQHTHADNVLKAEIMKK